MSETSLENKETKGERKKLEKLADFFFAYKDQFSVYVLRPFQ